jgi:hypothetical protein
MSKIGLGMELPPALAVTAGLIVLLAANLAYSLAGKLSVADMAGDDLGAAFLFTVAAFTRSVRVSQARAHVAAAQRGDGPAGLGRWT